MTPKRDTVTVPVEVPAEIIDDVRAELDATADEIDPARVRDQLLDHVEVRSEFVDDDGRRVVGKLLDALE